MAFGVSSLATCRTSSAGDTGHLITIDPFQLTQWEVRITAIEQAGFREAMS
jgi:hypothetical protein